MRRVSSTNNANTLLTWAASPDSIYFINDLDGLNEVAPFATPPGLITITTSANPTPTPTAVPPCTPKPVTTTQPVLDHFKAYVTTGPVNGDQVQLRDQFDPPDDPDVTPTPLPFKTVGSPVRYGAPVEKNHSGVVTPVTNPDAHLEMFQLLPAEPGTTRYVDVINQFGTQTLTVQDPVFVGVPTQQLPFGAPPADPNAGPFLDHYKIYNATGPAINVSVNLVDQFHQEPNVFVGAPRYFGNPTEKTHNGVVTSIFHAEDFLVCYDIGPQAFTTSIQTDNQFGPGNLVINPADLLCVPSQKTGFVEATPTPGASPPPTATATATARATATATSTPRVTATSTPTSTPIVSTMVWACSGRS
jgi:hypothetical protein